MGVTNHILWCQDENLCHQKVLIAPVKSTKKCSVVENGSCFALNNVEVMKRALGPYPIQDIFDGLLAPEGISNHMTDILLFNTILALGWIFGGSVYQLLLALNLSPETRSDIEQLGFWFGPDKFPISMGINIR